MLLIFALLLFVAMAIALFSFGTAFDEKYSQARLLRERLEAVRQAEERAPSEDLAILRDELMSEIPAMNRMLARYRGTATLHRLLSQSDIRVRTGKFILIMGCSGALVGLLLQSFARKEWLSILGALVGVLLPVFYAKHRRSRRFKLFEKQFPDAIDLLARAIRAGHTFTTALELIGTELNDPVAAEFRVLFEQQRFGLPVRDALLNLAERMPLMDVKFFVTTVMLQRETGGNLAEVLDKLSYVIRERFKILRQLRVYTAQGRMEMVMLLSIPPGLLLLLSFWNPDFIRPLFKDPIGNLMLLLATLLQVTGYFFIRKIIDIKV